MKQNLQRYMALLFTLTGLVSLFTKQRLDAGIWLTLAVSFLFVERLWPTADKSTPPRPRWSMMTGYALVLVASALLVFRIYLDFKGESAHANQSNPTLNRRN